MCGRYQFTAEQCAEILQIIQEVARRHGTGAWTPGEIRPTATAPVLISSVEEGIHPELQSWGYKMPGNLVINARAETVADKPMFRTSVASQRCVIPSTGFYEWDAQKRKYRFNLPGENALYHQAGGNPVEQVEDPGGVAIDERGRHADDPLGDRKDLRHGVTLAAVIVVFVQLIHDQAVYPNLRPL